MRRNPYSAIFLPFGAVSGSFFLLTGRRESGSVIDWSQLANGIVSWAVLGALGLLAAYIGKLMKKAGGDLAGMRTDIEKLKTSQRTQLKASIIRTCNEALERKWIYATELETLNRRAEEYRDLGGNTYVEAMVSRVNKECGIRGTVPEH